MNILYIGYKNEYDMAIINSLCEKHNVTVLCKKESEYELDCEYIVSKNLFNNEFFSDCFDMVLCIENSFSAEELNKFLYLSSVNNVEKFVALRICDLFLCGKSGLDISAMLLKKYNEESDLKTVLIKVPCIYGKEPPKEFLRFSKNALTKNSIELICKKSDSADLLNIDDFCAFISRAFDDEKLFDNEVILLKSAYPFEANSLKDALNKRYNKADICFKENLKDAVSPKEENSLVIDGKNGFKDLNKILEQAEFEVYKDSVKQKKGIRTVLYSLTIIFLTFFLIAFYTIMSPSSAEFQFVDIRLLFIVFISLILGKNYGYLSAGLCSVLFVVEKLLDGNAWYVLFYNINNWLTIVIYIVCSLILGMFLNNREKNRE